MIEKLKFFFTFLHITKSIYVSYDNIFKKIISERNDFILDQCALANMNHALKCHKKIYEHLNFML